MTTLIMALQELLRKHPIDLQGDWLKQGLQALIQAIMEAEVSEQVGAQRYERSAERQTYRNGYRTREWHTRLGTMELNIPKLRRGSYFPTFLEPRRRAEQALLAVVQEAYVQGVSTRKVDELIRTLGLEGISKSDVSRICAALDEQVERFRNRPLEGEYPYVWLDAKVLRVRQDGRVLPMAAVVAIGVRSTGEREVLGFDVGPSETYEFWVVFLRHLVERGLKGVQLVISDAHRGLRKALAEVLAGATWQRCRVHFLRNLLAVVPKHAQSEVITQVQTIFVQPDGAAARQRLYQVADQLQGRFPRAAALLLEAVDDVLAYMDFPKEHWRRIHSTNPLERLNREIGRRADVIGIFPNIPSALRLLGALLQEQQDEWIAGRRYFSEESMAQFRNTQKRDVQAETMT